ncbi:DUF2917 domain-containing protein [Ferribacterium limneticum]|uniref:DUF2917 domain-containing protein n=1 Tax=Ferribacterium limneticum TaxID=76259 RepID=UPI001CF9F614|nr:DUF2917 domain-containing protein [Ferribacterium limneticum]UCV30069.1 DUF2917 domain-containing protein [Ferribacterium limneticum]UCV33988.1 DUF2917 domain-containing protein [Ferribacterium limneticum]
MKIDLVSSELCLTNGNPIRLTKACGVRIRCISGTIWITLPDRLADIFLGAGESYLIDAQGLVLVESINEGRVRMEIAPKCHALTKLLEWPRCARIKRWHKQFTASI